MHAQGPPQPLASNYRASNGKFNGFSRIRARLRFGRRRRLSLTHDSAPPPPAART